MIDRLKKIAGLIFTYAQKVLMPPCLVFAYLAGIGPMALFSRLSSVLSGGKRTGGDTFWKPAKGYDADIPDAGEQS